MTELEDKLIKIYDEKEAKIIPENIKQGVTVFGVSGNVIENNSYVPSELEYIQIRGTIFFDTGYRHTGNTNVKAKFRAENNPETVGNYTAFFGARKTSYRYNAFSFFTKFNGSNFSFGRSGNETTAAGVYGEDVSISTNGKTVTCTTATRTFTITTTGTLDPGYNNLLIGACNMGDVDQIKPDTAPSDSLRIYYFQIYEGTTLVKDYVPYRNSNGKLGLLEKISNTFLEPYTTLISGPEVQE